MPAVKEKIMIGADPEFEVRDAHGNFIDADNVIETHSGRWGTDGCSDTGEIRPGPGTPEQVEKNISDILDRGVKELKMYGIYSGARKTVSLGGHIHFSGIMHDKKFIDSLDLLITEPLRKISNYRERERTGYGQNGQFYTNEHGWEYRAPCSWISHPYIARGVLQIAYECAVKYKADNSVFNTAEALIRYVSDNVSVDASEKIARFYVTIEKLIAKNAKLEDVEIFQAWRKKVLPPKSTDKVIPMRLITLTFSARDKNIIDIGNRCDKMLNKTFIEEMNVIICGAKTSRTDSPAIFVSQSIQEQLPTSIEGIKIAPWSRDKIGLSSKLREDIDKSVVVVNKIKWHLENYAKNKPGDQFKNVKENPIYIIEE